MHALIRKKASEEEIEVVIQEIQTLATQQGVEDILVPSTDAYVTSICSVGSKSLSHVLSCIERCKERLAHIGPNPNTPGSGSELARRQIITSVIEYWADHPGTAVNIIDKLLNYSIITPESVVEWALHDHMEHGRALAKVHIYEMISATMAKVSGQIRQIAAALANPDTAAEDKEKISAGLVQSRQTMRDLFNNIIDAVSAVANAAQDDMIERFDGDSAEQTLLQQWGARWAHVWKRKLAVEEAVVGEAAVEAAIQAANEAAEKAREAERVKMEAAEAAASAAAQESAAEPMEAEDHDVA